MLIRISNKHEQTVIKTKGQQHHKGLGHIQDLGQRQRTS